MTSNTWWFLSGKNVIPEKKSSSFRERVLIKLSLSDPMSITDLQSMFFTFSLTYFKSLSNNLHFQYPTWHLDVIWSPLMRNTNEEAKYRRDLNSRLSETHFWNNYHLFFKKLLRVYFLICKLDPVSFLLTPVVKSKHHGQVASLLPGFESHCWENSEHLWKVQSIF